MEHSQALDSSGEVAIIRGDRYNHSGEDAIICWDHYIYIYIYIRRPLVGHQAEEDMFSIK